MSNEAYASISNRMMSLEDIIRQQEQTIGVVLQRLRDVEQYAAAEARNREQAQQQFYQLLGERGGSSAEATQQMQALLHNQNERLGALQADLQGQAAALRGVDEKYNAALRGVEQRIQADVGGAQQRAQTGETTTMEAMRGLQAQLQSVSNATQAVDARSRDDLLAVQQQLSAEVAAQRQRTDNLESAIRDALRDVHGSLTGDLRSADAQHRTDLDGAVQRVSQSLEALDERTRADMNQLHAVEQGDVNELGRRIEELERNLRETLQANTNVLAGEVAQVAQHSQNLDRRQAAAHQTLLEELAKHDGQLESVDLNWRASVTDLNAVVRENVAAAQQQAAAGDQALQRQLKALEDRFTTAADALTRSMGDLARTVQEDCVKPVNEAQRVLSAQDQRLSHVADEYTAIQESLKTFAARVDQDSTQFKQAVEAAVRASHADILERLNLITTAAVTVQTDPETFRVEVNRALSKLWEDAKGVFLTQRSLNDVEAQLATLESAVRVELCALAERNNEVQRSVDAIRVAQRREAREDAASSPPASSRLPPAPVTCESAPVATAAASTKPAGAARRTSIAPAQTDEPPPPLQVVTSEPVRKTSSPRPKVEEIEQESKEAVSNDFDWRDGWLRQHDSDIKGLRASLNRLRLAQVQATDKAPAVAALLPVEDRASERDAVTVAAAAAATTQADGALHEAQLAASEAGGTSRNAAGAAEQANAASREAKSAASQASSSSREARSAAADAAESVKAAEAAQNETVRVANELRVALRRVGKLEATLQRRLEELSASVQGREDREESRPMPGRPARHDASASAATANVTAEEGEKTEREAKEAEGTNNNKKRNDDDDDDDGDDDDGNKVHAGALRRLYGEEEEPSHARRVNAATASQMAYSPKKASRPPSAPQITLSRTSLTTDNLLEVPGISTGEVFLVRQQENSSHSTPASLRQKTSFRDQQQQQQQLQLPPLPLAPTSLSSSAAAVVPSPMKPATPSESDVLLPTAPRRGSGLSEVLLPTHQFVRKREYNNYKDFTKQEIDAIWVELLNLRRNTGMPKEEVLLHVSQSKEQMLHAVLQIVQRQENETLEMLSGIKAQLAELRNDSAAMREVRVFPIDNGKNLEELMRAIGGGGGDGGGGAGNDNSTSKEPTEVALTRPTTSAALTTQAIATAGRAAATRPSTTSVDAAKAFKTSSQLPPRQMPASAPAACITPLLSAATSHVEQTAPPSARVQWSTDRDTDTAASSGRSVSPLTPQVIPQVVHRRSSLSSKDELTEVFFAEIDHTHPPRLLNKPQRGQPTSAQHLEATPSGPLNTHQYAVAAPVDPATVAPASRLAEPASATPQYRPTGLTPPAQRTSPEMGSRPSSAKIDAAQRLPLGLANNSDTSPRRIVPPYVSSGAVEQPLPHKYQIENQEPMGAPQRYLKEGKSPRNAAGNAFHLNPLHDLHNVSDNPQESSCMIPREKPKPHVSRPPRYQLIEKTPPSQASTSTSKPKEKPGADPPPSLTDTSPGKYQPVSMQEDSDIYYESVGDQRPARGPLRRLSNSTDNNTPTHALAAGPEVRDTQPPEHLRNRLASAPERPSAVPRSRGHTAGSQPSPRRQAQREQEEEEPQYPPLLPPPQPQPRRDYTSVHESSADAVRTSNSPSRCSPFVQVLPSKGPIHLGPYNPPRDSYETDEDRRQRMESGTGGAGVVSPDVNHASRPLSSTALQEPQPQQPPAHADHNPHVYAPYGGYDWDVYSTSQSLGGTPSPERGNRSRTPASRHVSSISLVAANGPPTATSVAPAVVVPVRVLDGQAGGSAGNAPPPASAATIRIHPYQDRREL